MIGIVLALVVGCLVWYNFVRPMSYWAKKGAPQTKPWPVVGDFWFSVFRIKSFPEFVEWVYQLHPDARYCGFYQFNLPVLAIRDPELIKQVTVKDFDHFVDHNSIIAPESDPLWNGNLFALTGQKWREMRATLSGSFTSSKMKNMFHLMEDAAEKFVQFFLNKNEDVIELELKDAFTRYTNDVIATTAFGIQVDSLSQPNNEFYLMGKEATNFATFWKSLKFIALFLVPKLCKLFKIPVFGKNVSTFFRTIINETIKTREKNGIVRNDMINLLLEARKGSSKSEEKEVEDTGFATVKESSDILFSAKFRQNRNLTNEDITAQALIFFFAGFDTVSTALCFGSYELALNGEIQDLLRKEIGDTHKEVNGKITYEVLLKMKYLDMVVSEILRKWPAAVAMDRICTKPYVIQPIQPEEEPIHLKVGDVLLLPAHAIHRDPKYYENPTKFDPERFSDHNKDNIQPYTYFPFGSGPRNCIGSRFALLEIKALLFNLLLHFKIVPTKKTPIPLRLNRKSFNHTAEGGFWLGLERIKT